MKAVTFTKEEEKKIVKMINRKNTNPETLKKALRKYQTLPPRTLGLIAEKIAAPNKDGYSRTVSMDELVAYHPSFKTVNGTSWARSDVSYLGKKYIIMRGHNENGINGVSSIKLDGLNKNIYANKRQIRDDIRQKLLKQPCAVLGVHANNEIDHKNGKYNEPSNLSLATQKEEDFQCLSRSVNLAKRTHCARCQKTGIRFDATILGFSVPYLYGDAHSKTCEGCYWNDPLKFTKTISANYIKPD